MHLKLFSLDHSELRFIHKKKKQRLKTLDIKISIFSNTIFCYMIIWIKQYITKIIE